MVTLLRFCFSLILGIIIGAVLGKIIGYQLTYNIGISIAVISLIGIIWQLIMIYIENKD